MEELVIKIDKNVFTRLFDNGIEDYEIANDDLFAIAKAIRNGTPLEEKTGNWVEENINGGRKVFCSECGCPPPFEYVSTGDVYSASGYGVINKTKFCPNCGTRMKNGKWS